MIVLLPTTTIAKKAVSGSPFQKLPEKQAEGGFNPQVAWQYQFTIETNSGGLEFYAVNRKSQLKNLPPSPFFNYATTSFKRGSISTELLLRLRFLHI